MCSWVVTARILHKVPGSIHRLLTARSDEKDVTLWAYLHVQQMMRLMNPGSLATALCLHWMMLWGMKNYFFYAPPLSPQSEPEESDVAFHEPSKRSAAACREESSQAAL